MNIDRKALIMTFEQLEESLHNYSLPTWDDLPDIPLYMDQIVTLLEKYLDLYSKAVGTETLITPAMINNYVKLKTIPAPIKKKYSRIHLSYLLIVCTLKQTLDMATINRLMPYDLPEQQVKQTYNSFVENQKKAFSYVTMQTRAVADPIFALGENNPSRLNDLVFQASTSANIFKILTEKMSLCLLS